MRDNEEYYKALEKFNRDDDIYFFSICEISLITGLSSEMLMCMSENDVGYHTDDGCRKIKKSEILNMIRDSEFA